LKENVVETEEFPETMEPIIYENPKVFIPDTLHVEILLTVTEKQGCSIRHVIDQLITRNNERIIRKDIHELLAKRYLDEGSPNHDRILRLTSKGRILLQKTVF
jgi:hypothetical protein